MILFPSIDLKGGKCVRLLKGDMSVSTVFNDNPTGQARLFEEAGCKWIHLVDLDGATEGRSINGKFVASIVEAMRIPVQLGGGLREIRHLEFWFDKGVSRAVLGTAAVENPDLVRVAAQQFPGQVAVAIDARGGVAATRGWAKDSEVTAIELARRFEDAGISAIIYTDIERDGTMEGPNVRATAELAESVSVPVIASGGVSSLEDLAALRDCGVPLEGVISGRALYDGAIGIEEALALLANTKDGSRDGPEDRGMKC